MSGPRRPVITTVEASHNGAPAPRLIDSITAELESIEARLEHLTPKETRMTSNATEKASAAAHVLTDPGVTDTEIEAFLQEAGSTPTTERGRMGLLLRTRRAGRHLDDGARNAVQVGKGALKGYVAKVQAVMAHEGTARGLLSTGKHGAGTISRLLKELIGWGAAINLLVATERGRRILARIARPFVTLGKIGRALLRLTPAEKTVASLEAKAADKFERVDAALNVRKHADINSWMMFRYRLAAVFTIASKVLVKVGPKVAPSVARFTPAGVVVVFLLTDRKTAPMLRSFWKRVTATAVETKATVAEAASTVVATATEVVQTPLDTTSVDLSVVEQPQFDTASKRRKAARAAKRVAQENAAIAQRAADAAAEAAQAATEAVEAIEVDKAEQDKGAPEGPAAAAS